MKFSKNGVVAFVMLAISLTAYFLAIPLSLASVNCIAVVSVLFVSLYLLTASQAWIFFLLIFALVFANLSLLLSESFELFLGEVMQFAHLTGASGRSGFLSCFFLLFSYLSYLCFCRLLPEKPSPISVIEKGATEIALVIANLISLFLLFGLFKYGSPLTKGMDRFQYFSGTAEVFRYAYGLVPMMGALVGMLLIKRRISKVFAYGWVFLTVLILLLLGEKFSKFILLFFFFLLPVFIRGETRLGLVALAKGGVALLVLVVVVLINYQLVYGSPVMFLARLVLQGQMIFALDLNSGFPQSWNDVSRYFLGLGISESEDAGMHYLMSLVAPSDIVNERISVGATFTAPFPGNLFYFFGYTFSPIAAGLMAIVLGFVAAVTVSAVKGGNLVLYVVSVKTFLLLYVAVIMGDVHHIFSVKFLIHLVAIALALLAVRATSNTSNYRY